MSSEMAKVLLVLSAAAGAAAVCPALGANGARWDNMPATGPLAGKVAALTGDPRYPESPTAMFVSPTMYHSFGIGWGKMLSGYLMPPTTGTYTFYISSDDEGQFFLSTDNSAANLQLIASAPASTAISEWNKFPSQQSTGIPLVAGRSYYFELLSVDLDTNNHVQGAWTVPGTSSIVRITQPFLCQTPLPDLCPAAGLDVRVDGATVVTTQLSGAPTIPMAGFTLGRVSTIFTTAFHLTQLPTPAGAKVTLDCCKMGGNPCHFFIVVYHCPPCTTKGGGLWDTLTASDGWDVSGACSPKVLNQGAWPTLVYHRTVDAGQTYELNLPAAQLPYFAILTSLNTLPNPWCKRPQGPSMDGNKPHPCQICAPAPLTEA